MQTAGPRMNEGRRFEIAFEGFCTLEEEDLWPDNDGPELPTAHDVIGLMRHEGSPFRVIERWNLDDSLTLAVRCPGTPGCVRYPEDAA